VRAVVVADDADSLGVLCCRGVQDARRAVAAFLAIIAGIAVAFITMIASGAKTSPWHHGWFIFWVVVLAIAVVAALAAEVPDFAQWLGDDVRRWKTSHRPPTLVFDRWRYTSKGADVQQVRSVMDLALPGPGYSKQPADRLSWVRVVVLIASTPVSPDKDFEKRQSLFEAFLGQPPVASLVSSLASGGGTGLSWKRAVKAKRPPSTQS
jgi:hypothetical protein